jgi:hypothetical protein
MVVRLMLFYSTEAQFCGMEFDKNRLNNANHVFLAQFLLGKE